MLKIPKAISQEMTLYAKHWGIETSFRELKYAVGLVNFHAKKREYIVLEIFAKLTMYNFAEMITSHVVIQQTDTKHTYQVNFTIAIHIYANVSCIAWVMYSCRMLKY